ncbi:MAG: cyanophycinase [Acidobacteriota bacterium]
MIGAALVIVGGALAADNRPVHEAIVERVLPERSLCIVPLASAEPTESANAVAADFEVYSGKVPLLRLDFTQANGAVRARDPEFVQVLRSCGGFFFTGGDQSRIVDILLPGGEVTPALAAIREVLAEGGVMSGSSAGAAMMSDPMIGSGDAELALKNGLVAAEDQPGVWLRNGMGFFAAGLTDQHFLRRGRLGRVLAVLSARRDIPLAIGVDENSAALVDGDDVYALGASGVMVLDMRGAERDGPLFRNATLWLLGHGDHFDLARGIAQPAGEKSTVRACRAPRPPRHPWRESSFASWLGCFAASSRIDATLRAERFRLRLARGVGYRSVAIAGSGPYGVPKGLFAGPFAVSLTH